MTRKAKIATCPYCHGCHSRGYRCEAEFESWEIDYELHERQDYAGLVAHYKAVVEWEDGSHHGLFNLGEAYVLNGEPEKAVELLAEPHRQNPDDEEFQHVILGALFALGKDETHFDWVERIPVYRLDDSSFLDRCHAYLRPKRKPRDAEGLRLKVGIDGYCAFSADELLQAIRRDTRFVVEEDEFGYPEVRVRRKRESKTKPPRAAAKHDPDWTTSRRDRIVAARASAIAESRGVPIIPEPEADDPELKRTRLYPTWGGEKFYGEPMSREEEDRQLAECLDANSYWEEGDFEGLIAHYFDILSRRPSDLAALHRLGLAHLENSEPEAVLELIGAAHRHYPRLLDFQELLLEALAALGRDETDFDWASELRIVRLDSDAADLCHEYLKRKRRPRFGSELVDALSREGSCPFSGSDLLAALRSDDRFIFEDGGVRRRRRREDAPRSVAGQAERKERQ